MGLMKCVASRVIEFSLCNIVTCTQNTCVLKIYSPLQFYYSSSVFMCTMYVYARFYGQKYVLYIYLMCVSNRATAN